MKYNHTQIGYVFIGVLVVIVLYLGYIITQIDDNSAIIIMFIAVILITSFTSLNITIDEMALKVKFGYGVFQKRIYLNEITSVKIVTNKWYYGWGIKAKFNPFTRIYNISGLDAVEIETDSGNIYRIGTDEPKTLEYAIKQSIKK